ncbi:MAG: hypothetical protein WBD02_08545 [Acidimicrobiia bacterium]
MHITAASYAYPHVSGDVRAELARRLQSRVSTPNVFILATCLRIEVVVHGDDESLSSTLAAVFGGAPESAHGKVRSGEDAVAHLFRISAGLESPILGEREILAQFRQAVVEAQTRGEATGMFAKLLETAVAAGRQARELLPDSPHDSMAAVAAQAVGGIEQVAVLGSGTMANAVILNLRGLPAPPEITVVARSPEKVTAEGVAVWSFDRAEEALRTFPAVVSATSAKTRVISDEMLEATVGARSTPITIVDMAMPPDFRPPAVAHARYLNIDDLARMADRRPRRDDADVLVQNAAADAHRRFVDHHEVSPVIADLMALADEIVERTVEKFSGRLERAEDRDVLRQTAHTVARTLLSGPVSYLKQGDREPEAVDAIADAFGIDDD